MRAALVALALCLSGCSGEDSLAVDNGSRGNSSALNAFGLGYFAGLTVGISDVALGGCMTRGDATRARADRLAHEELDSLGKVLGFATLLVGGWRLYSRRRRDAE